MKKIKVAIIGAGTAGLSARKEVAKKTDDYLVFDGGQLGTTCARVGCMPSKSLIQIANDYKATKYLKSQEILNSADIELNLSNALKKVRMLRDRFTDGVISDMKKWEDKFINKHVKFLDPNTIETNDQKYFAEKIIIATGSEPIIPKQFEAYKDYLIDTDQFFELENISGKIIVIGLGVIGVELGQALYNLDLNVTLVGSENKNIGGLTDPNIKKYVSDMFIKNNNAIFSRASITGTLNNQLEVKINDKVHYFDKAIIATGRSPNIDNLNLAKANIKLNNNGLPDYCDKTFALKEHSHIFFVGDVNKQRPLLHEAADQGKIAGFNATENKNTCFNARTPLIITFTEPNIAIVGQSFKSLSDKNIDFIIGSVCFEGQGRSIIKNNNQGILNIYVEKSTGIILGAEMQAPDGEHLAHLISWAIANGLTVEKALNMPFYHPVVEEGLRTSLRDANSKLEYKKDFMDLFRCEDPPVM